MPAIEIGLFVVLLGVAVVCFLLINRVKILVLLSAVIFFGLALFFVSDYDVVATALAQNVTTNQTVYNASTGAPLTNSSTTEYLPNGTLLIIDASQSGLAVGWIFMAFGLVAIISYFGKALSVF